MNYAAKLGIPFTVFLGEDEIAAGTATVKNMNMANDFSEEELQRLAAEGCHKQITLPADEAVTYIKKHLDTAAQPTPICDRAAIAARYGLESPGK